MHNKPVRKILRPPYSRATRSTVPSDTPARSPAVDLAQLGHALRTTFVELSADATQQEFVTQSRFKPHSRIRTLVHRILRTFVSDYDANALLAMYPMHLLGTEQWRSLLQLKGPGRLLDVGAGDGGLTQHLAPLFTSITTSETSRHMAKRLRQRGFECLLGDVTQFTSLTKYDCITCLNVVDRTPTPRHLVSYLANAIEPGGYLVLATPLPIRAFYYQGPQTLEPREQLATPGPSWERAANQFVALIQEVAPQLALQRWSRTPYLSWGDSEQGLYVLDDFVGVWSLPPAG